VGGGDTLGGDKRTGQGFYKHSMHLSGDESRMGYLNSQKVGGERSVGKRWEEIRELGGGFINTLCTSYHACVASQINWLPGVDRKYQDKHKAKL